MAKRTGIMLAKPYERHLIARMPDKVIVQPKIDGDRIRAVPTREGYQLLTSSGKVMPCLPHINSALNEMFTWGGFAPTLDGEGYIHGMPQQDIHSICSRKKEWHPGHLSMEYHIFDIIAPGNQDSRVESLPKIIKQGKTIKVLESRLIPRDDWQNSLRDFLELGYEGIIIRDPDALYSFGKQSCILKYKPGKEDYYKVIGAKEALSIEGDLKGMLGALLLQDKHGNQFFCGAGCLKHDERILWWKLKGRLYGMIAHVRYLKLTNSNLPREPVLVEILEANASLFKEDEE